MASQWNTTYFNDSEIIAYLEKTVGQRVRIIEFVSLDVAVDNQLHLRVIHKGHALHIVATVEALAPGVMRVSEFGTPSSNSGTTSLMVNLIDSVQFPALVTSEERLYNSLGDAQDAHQRRVIDQIYEGWLNMVPYPASVSTADVHLSGERLRFGGLHPLTKAEPALPTVVPFASTAKPNR
jgi:hypothetical protein